MRPFLLLLGGLCAKQGLCTLPVNPGIISIQASVGNQNPIDAWLSAGLILLMLFCQFCFILLVPRLRGSIRQA